MSFNLKHPIVLASGIAAGAVCLIAWCQVDSDPDQAMIRLQAPALESLTSVENAVPELMNSSAMGEAQQLEPQLESQIAPPFEQQTAIQIAPEFAKPSVDQPSDLDSTLLTSGVQPETGNVNSLVDLDNGFVLPNVTSQSEELELAPEMLVELGETFEAQVPDVVVETPFSSETAPVSDIVASRIVDETLVSPKAFAVEAASSDQETMVADSLVADSSQTNRIGWKTNPFFNKENSNPAESITAPAKPKAAPVNQLPTSSSQPITQSVPRSVVTQAGMQMPAVPKRKTAPFMGLSESVAHQAVHHIEYGKSLARRGAAYAARQEFFSALRVVAQANDAKTGGTDFSTALTDAISAMKEAEDFIVENSEMGVAVDVPSTIEAHKTKILTERQARGMSPLAAMQMYYGFAHQQLDFAGGRNVVTAEALYCLGKLHTVMARNKKVMPGNLDVAKAIVFHKASMMSNPQNPSSANELGVLMAKTGQLRQATDLFKQSLVTQASPQAWHNLAKTHHRLGEVEMAQMAETEMAMAANSSITSATAGIQWVGNGQFNAMAPTEFETRVASNQTPVRPADASSVQQASQTEEKSEGKSFSERIKSWLPTRESKNGS